MKITRQQYDELRQEAPMLFANDTHLVIWRGESGDDLHMNLMTQTDVDDMIEEYREGTSYVVWMEVYKFTGYA